MPVLKKLTRLAALSAIAAAFALSACVETKNNSTVNPDGSTKVTIDALIQPPPDMSAFGAPAASAPKPDPAKLAKSAAANFLRSAKGVDAWSAVSTEVAKDGRIHILATAYAPDINKFHLDMVPPVKYTVDAAGNGKLELSKDKPPAASAPAPKTDEQIKAEVDKAKTDYKQMRGMMGPILNKMKLDLTYTLPGTVSSAVIFTKTGPNSANFVMEGRKMLAAMDTMMADDAALTASIKAGKKADENDDAMFLQIYGAKGPAVVLFAGATKPQFDFKAESAAAKDKQDAMLKEAGIDLTQPKNPMGMPGGMPMSGPDDAN